MADGEARLENAEIDGQESGIVSQVLRNRQTPFWVAGGFGVLGAATLIGSHGWVEIAVNSGNAKLELDVNIGFQIRIIY